ncbi:tetratricopeptide repeat protein 27 [Frieseomelitta varia]|uniref:tetratricopeptide repeat protein 27 n=1 Tax=Frieseomelitta varia TaxID=561572 RepID=UPI001CB6A3EE|nr:tetratricopeptide repeat protein 27 [Frieseomelitta varia]
MMNLSDVRKPINKEIEILILTNSNNNEVQNLPICVQNILNGDYENVMNDELFSILIQELNGGNDVSKFINDNIEKTNLYDSWLCTGIASLLYFIQQNWTGPEVKENIKWQINKENVLKDLSLHDEYNANVKMPHLLYFSKIIFSNEILQNVYESCIWWLFRTNLLHQLILNESSGIIFDETEKLIKEISNLQLLKEDFYCETLLYIEVAQFYFYYRRIQNSEKYIELAQERAKLSLNLEGALGKRTKYQEDKAQLFLRITLEKEQFPSRDCENLPKSLDLNDDIRLEHIEFSRNIENTQLGAMEEAIILAKYIQLQLSQPRDKLTDEEVTPYLTVVVNNTRNWSLKVASLYYRCSLESGDKRTVERSMIQMEYLIHELNKPNVSVANRMDLFFASGFKPVWTLEQMWAQLMLSLGLVKDALDIFLKLKLWEEVIACYNILELKHKAAEIIEQEISKKPSVQLWCLLGDATQNPNCYKTAWELSSEKSSRAQRQWGFFYFAKQNYEKAIPHLKLSVELNHIQEDVWIRLGFAALQVEDWKLAVTAYKHYCALEQTTFEAWNNLAKAYIKLGDKAKAWKSLQDAIKCNYDQWQIWDNLMVVSIDLGHFSEVIRCYHRILDLKNHHLDVQILDILTNSILNNINDSDGNFTQKLLPKVLELFGRITSFIPNNSEVWRMYGQLTVLKKTDIDNEKAIQYLQQAHRIVLSDAKWLLHEESVEKVLQLCHILAETYLQYASNCELKKKRTLLASAKLSLQGVVKKVKDKEWNAEKIYVSMEKVEKYLNTVVAELEQIKMTN